LHWTVYVCTDEDVFDGYVQVPLSSEIFVHDNTVPFPQSNSIAAFDHDGEVLHTTVVLHHALLNEFVAISGGIHINDPYSCVTSSQSILLSFRYMHAKFVLLSWLVHVKTLPVRIIYPLSHGFRVIHVNMSTYTH
jgi:hypothetical protein